MGHRKHGSMYKGKYPIGAIKLMEIMIQYQWRQKSYLRDNWTTYLIVELKIPIPIYSV